VALSGLTGAILDLNASADTAAHGGPAAPAPESHSPLGARPHLRCPASRPLDHVGRSGTPAGTPLTARSPPHVGDSPPLAARRWDGTPAGSRR
jgi:hypothetical protein